MSITDHEYEYDICVVGAGRIGLPWAATLAYHGIKTRCVDIDSEIVASIESSEAPFEEPHLDRYIQSGINSSKLSATTDQTAVTEAKAVAYTLNAPRDQVPDYLDILSKYAEHMDSGQAIINRTTLPVAAVEEAINVMAGRIGIESDDLDYITFPERLAEGSAIHEIETLPKILGTHQESSKNFINELLKPFSGDQIYLDHEMAMFVKLIDNTYRDARFAIANQLALLGDDIGLNAYEAIEIANKDYPRNDIPLPGPIGGKCLTKDPHFLSDEEINLSDSTPDLFQNTRHVNVCFENRLLEKIMNHEPSIVAILGTAYKKDHSDETNSPGRNIQQDLEKNGIEVLCYDPFAGGDTELRNALKHADVTIVAMNHTEFYERRNEIKRLSAGPIIDAWGIFKPDDKIEYVGNRNRRLPTYS